jgi:hypothetical protein
LARGTAVYTAFGDSQSEYLVMVTDGGKSTLARLLYRHRLSHAEIPSEMIDSAKPVTMHIFRTADCDESYRIISTAFVPGPFSEIVVRDALHFVSGVESPAVADGEVVPCYSLSPQYVRQHRKYVSVN